MNTRKRLIALVLVAGLATGLFVGLNQARGGSNRVYVSPDHPNSEIGIGAVPEGGGYQEIGGDFEWVTPTAER